MFRNSFRVVFVRIMREHAASPVPALKAVKLRQEGAAVGHQAARREAPCPGGDALPRTELVDDAWRVAGVSSAMAMLKRPATPVERIGASTRALQRLLDPRGDRSHAPE
jgi:hypothetical protein